MITNIWDFLKGKKTYIAAACMVIAGLITDNHALVLEGLAIAGIRHAITIK